MVSQWKNLSWSFLNFPAYAFPGVHDPFNFQINGCDVTHHKVSDDPRDVIIRLRRLLTIPSLSMTGTFKCHANMINAIT